MSSNGTAGTGGFVGTSLLPILPDPFPTSPPLFFPVGTTETAGPVTPVAPAEGSPVAPAEGSPVAPAEGSPVAPAEGSPVAPAEGSPALISFVMEEA